MRSESRRVAWFGPLWSRTGYGTHNRELVLRLVELVPQLELWPTERLPESVDDEVMKLIGYVGSRRDPRPVDLVVQCTPTTPYRHQAAYSVLLTTIESLHAHPLLVMRCRQHDEVWVPSKMNVRALPRWFRKERPVYVMPEGVDTAKYNATSEGIRWWPGDDRVYLYHGDWQERKGVRFLIEAWRVAHDEMPGAKLKLIAKKGMSTELSAARALVRELDMYCGDDGPHGKLGIEVIHGTLPESTLCSMYRSAYCGVFPTRGEAWNLAPCQMAACGTPVIVTAWGGHLEYLSPLSAFLIPVEAFRWISPDGNCGVESYCQQQFAVPDVLELIRLLKWTYGHPESVRRRGARAMEVVSRLFTWDQAAQKVAKRMEVILSGDHVQSDRGLFARPPRKEVCAGGSRANERRVVRGSGTRQM